MRKTIETAVVSRLCFLVTMCRMKHGQASVDNSAENLHVDDENPNVQPAAVFETDINDAYEKMTVWRKNMFQLPKGHQGKEFIKEMTKQINLWTSNSPLRHISIKCLMVMPRGRNKDFQLNRLLSPLLPSPLLPSSPLPFPSLPPPFLTPIPSNVGHHGWPTKKILHSRSSKTATNHSIFHYFSSSFKRLLSAILLKHLGGGGLGVLYRKILSFYVSRLPETHISALIFP